MKLEKLTELGLIERIRKSIKNSSSVFKGIGEDCAVVEFDKRRYMLLCCDMLLEGVDFTHQTRAYLVGRKAIGSSLSDIASKCGLPEYALVSLGIPKNKSYRFIKDLYRGINYWAKKFKVDIVGGDISRSNKLVIDISLVGLVEKKNLILRSEAKVDDIIFVTGKLGETALRRHLYFKPRIEEARYLTENYKLNSMIDISDGLVLDLYRLIKESNVGAILYEKLIPKSRGSQIKEALYKGEQFELLFTLAVKEAKKLLAKKNKLYSAIGQITKPIEGLKLIKRNCQEIILKPKGYQHF